MCIKKQGYIYVFQNYNYIKLGFSYNVKKRLNELTRWKGELKQLYKRKGTIEDELKFHAILKRSGRYFGQEWYPISRLNEILDLISS